MFAIVAVLVIGIYFLLTPTFTEGALTEEQAISAAISAHPELAAYQTTSLPPSSIETKRAPDGWYLGIHPAGKRTTGNS
jgi:hypothetical protein